MSSSAMRPLWDAEQQSRPVGRRLRRRALLGLCLPLLGIAAVTAVLYAHSQGSATASRAPTQAVHTQMRPTQPADWFIQSIVTGDGALGWHQLCPNIQAQLPLDVLVQQASTVHAAAVREGVWPTVIPLGTHPNPNPGGGEYHLYRVIAHWPNGATQQEMFSVLTQPSGCVEDVQTSS